MKKIVVITLVIAFFSVFVVPKQAKAGGGASGAIVGAAIGAVVGLVAWAASSSADSPQKADKPEKQGRLLKDKDFTLETWSEDHLSSSVEKDSKKAVPIYSFRMVF